MPLLDPKVFPMGETLPLAHQSVSPSLREAAFTLAKPCSQSPFFPDPVALPDRVPPPSKSLTSSLSYPGSLPVFTPVPLGVLCSLAGCWLLAGGSAILLARAGPSRARQELGVGWLLSKVLTGIKPRISLVTPATLRAIPGTKATTEAPPTPFSLQSSQGLHRFRLGTE